MLFKGSCLVSIIMIVYFWFKSGGGGGGWLASLWFC